MAKLSRREREKMQRRNDIINAAEKKFFEKGFDEVSMDEIARELELSKPTLYLYFKNKESLFFAVVLRGMVILRDTLKSAVEKENVGLDKILSLSHAIFDYMQKYMNYYRLNVVARGERFWNSLGNQQIEGSESYVKYVVELFDLVKDSVQLGIQDGSLRKGLDPLETTIFLSSTIETTALVAPYNQILLSQSGLTLDVYQQHSIDVLLRGIARKKKKE